MNGCWEASDHGSCVQVGHFPSGAHARPTGPPCGAASWRRRRPAGSRRDVLLIRNHRRAIGHTLLEVPAGTLELGEDPKQAAVRELAEETGAVAAKWSSFGHLWPAPGFCDERLHLFIAEDLTLGAPQLEEHEEIERVLVPQEQAIQSAAAGDYADAKTAIMILRFASRKG